jgi:hypothetical protein
MAWLWWAHCTRIERVTHIVPTIVKGAFAHRSSAVKVTWNIWQYFSLSIVSDETSQHITRTKEHQQGEELLPVSKRSGWSRGEGQKLRGSKFSHPLFKLLEVTLADGRLHLGNRTFKVSKGDGAIDFTWDANENTHIVPSNKHAINTRIATVWAGWTFVSGNTPNEISGRRTFVHIFDLWWVETIDETTHGHERCIPTHLAIQERQRKIRRSQKEEQTQKNTVILVTQLFLQTT